MKKSVEYKGVAGKVIEKIVFLNQRPHPGEACVEIMFRDKTSLYVEMRPGVTVAPELVSWKTGEYRPLRSYPAVTSRGR
jgi:hypothetical protein